MTVSSALRAAINLRLMPMQSQLFRKAPLPDGMDDLLRIATGDEEIIKKAVLTLERPQQDIEDAVGYFIEHVLMAPASDSYRVLGTNPDATSSELRRNMALITRYLHPDLDINNERSVFITRVTGAWNNLKTSEKRAAYDQKRKAPAPTPKKRRSMRPNGRKTVVGSPGKNSLVSVHHLSRERKWRGAFLRQMNRLLMKFSGN